MVNKCVTVLSSEIRNSRLASPVVAARRGANDAVMYIFAVQSAALDGFALARFSSRALAPLTARKSAVLNANRVRYRNPLGAEVITFYSR